MRRTTGEPRELWGILLAGGAGQRLRAVTRALSGRALPKQFCRFGGVHSLLQISLRRITPLIRSSRIVVVVNDSYAGRARRQIGDRRVRTISQPADRGTAAGVLLPLLHILHEDPNALVALVPSDHAIGDNALYRESLRCAACAIRAGGPPLVLFGASPVAANPDYGWIEAGETLYRASGAGLRAVTSFVEKPAPARAQALFRAGALWNTMVLVADGAFLLERFECELPEMAKALRSFADLPAEGSSAYLQDCYRSFPVSDFSRDLIEKAALDAAVLTWPREVGWTDLGTPERLLDWMGSQGRTRTAAGLRARLASWARPLEDARER